MLQSEKRDLCLFPAACASSEELLTPALPPLHCHTQLREFPDRRPLSAWLSRLSKLVCTPRLMFSLMAGGLALGIQLLAPASAAGEASQVSPVGMRVSYTGLQPGDRLPPSIEPLSSSVTLQSGEPLPTLAVFGVLHMVRRGETLEDIATLYNIPIGDIVSYGPNEIVAGSPLPQDKEIFIPGARPVLHHRRTIARRDVLSGGGVMNDRDDARQGPGDRYPRVGVLEKGTLVWLLARHKDWLKVRMPDGNDAWVAAEILTVPRYLLGSLPLLDDVPPPPTWTWPTEGIFTSPFGWRDKPWPMFHDGIDIANVEGTLVVAARDGTVMEAGWCKGYGYCVKISHDEGFETVYAHLMTRPMVKTGDTVYASQPIGLLGSSFDPAGGGYSTGPHLHFILKRDGQPVDPLGYLP